MRDLAERYGAAIDHLDLPTRDLVHPVLSLIEDRSAMGHRRQPLANLMQFRTSRLAVGFAVCLAALCAVMLTVEPSRTAIADWFGIGATTVEQNPEPRISESSAVEEPVTTLTNSVDELGDPTGAADVQPIPKLGNADVVFDDVDRSVQGRSYVWRATEEFPALGTSEMGVVLSVRTTAGVIDRKLLAADQGVEFVVIKLDGTDTSGLWIDGSHELVRSGGFTVRAERVLLWEDRTGTIQFRLETDATREKVIALATQVVGGQDLLQPP